MSRERWIAIPGLGLHPRLAVTSIRALLEGKSAQEWAADRWLRRAPGPQANTAAVSLERAVSAVCPTA
jgi:hypothetical protein